MTFTENLKIYEQLKAKWLKQGLSLRQAQQKAIEEMKTLPRGRKRTVS